MPDIMMCSNDECPSKGSCYRFLATPSAHRQSYSKFVPDHTGYCDLYMLARCCVQSQHQWGMGEYGGEWHSCLYCGKDWMWDEKRGTWLRTANG